MSLNSVIFIDSYPKLDLHGLDRDSARMYINEFINENMKLKNEIFVIVHGIGSGILKKTTHDALKTNKNVVEYKTFYHNHGCTLVQIRISAK